MPALPTGPLVAIANDSREVLDLLETILAHAGFRPVRASPLAFKRGDANLETFMRRYDPPVVLWDVAVPYDENWDFAQDVCRRHGGRRHFIITTPNKRALESFAGATAAREVIGKPYDTEEILAAVRHAIDAGRDDPP